MARRWGYSRFTAEPTTGLISISGTAAVQMGGVDGVCAAEDIGRLSFTRRPAHGLCTFWRPRLDLSGMKALHPGRGLLMHCMPRV